MRILLTGAAGMLASALVPELVASGHEVVTTDIDLSVERPWGPDGPSLSYLDVRDREAVEDAVDILRPDLVAHLAAETSLEVCERDRDHAVLTNTLATKHVTLAARRIGAPIAYISTAGVFDGTKETGPYNELDTPNPLNLYGATKLAGERLVQTLHPGHYIVRAGWMVGGGPGKDHKFVARIVEQVRAGATVVYAVGDKLGTPTYAPDFARCFEQLIRSESFGLYHLTGRGGASRFDVAQEILRIIGATDVEVVEVGSEHFAEEFFAARPRSELMENLMLELQGLNTMRPWQEALEEYLTTQFADLVVPSGSVSAS
jgi:dTDP-4-dehydrorhamnose reductase